jgi:chitinase
VQGAVLSVTLFLVAMSQMHQNVALPTKIIGYADDWVIFTRDHNMQNTQANLQLTAKKIASWAGNIRFLISPEIILFGCTYVDETQETQHIRTLKSHWIAEGLETTHH